MSARIDLGGVVVELNDQALDALAEKLADHMANGASASDWLRGAEAAAQHLSCKPRRIYELVQREAIPFHRDGSRLMFRRAELDTWALSDCCPGPAGPMNKRGGGGQPAGLDGGQQAESGS